MVLSINYDEFEGKRYIEVFQLKRLSNNSQDIDINLRFVRNCQENMLVLYQDEPVLMQFIPD